MNLILPQCEDVRLMAVYSPGLYCVKLIAKVADNTRWSDSFSAARMSLSNELKERRLYVTLNIKKYNTLIILGKCHIQNT